MSISTRDTVHRTIKRSNFNMIFFAIVLIVASIGAFAFLTVKPLIRAFGEKQVLSANQIIEAGPETLPLYNIEITAVQTIDTGYEEYTTENGVRKSTDAYFGLLVLDDDASKGLLVRSTTPINESVLSYRGSIWEPTNIVKDIYNDILRENPDLQGIVLFQVLDTDLGAQALSAVTGVVLEVVFMLAGLVILFIGLGRGDHNNHPIIQRLDRFGDSESVMSQIDAERDVSGAVTVEKLQFTPKWIIYHAGNETAFMRLADVVWVYKIVNPTRYGKNAMVSTYDRTGQQLLIEGNGPSVDAMVGAILERAPWAVAAYNADIEKTWKTDRERFIQSVDKRRQKIERLATWSGGNTSESAKVIKNDFL